MLAELSRALSEYNSCAWARHGSMYANEPEEIPGPVAVRRASSYRWHCEEGHLRLFLAEAFAR